MANSKTDGTSTWANLFVDNLVKIAPFLAILDN